MLVVKLLDDTSCVKYDPESRIRSICQTVFPSTICCFANGIVREEFAQKQLENYKANALELAKNLDSITLNNEDRRFFDTTENQILTTEYIEKYYLKLRKELDDLGIYVG